jgi:hypothetical protein
VSTSASADKTSGSPTATATAQVPAPAPAPVTLAAQLKENSKAFHKEVANKQAGGVDVSGVEDDGNKDSGSASSAIDLTSDKSTLTTRKYRYARKICSNDYEGYTGPGPKNGIATSVVYNEVTDRAWIEQINFQLECLMKFVIYLMMNHGGILEMAEEGTSSVKKQNADEAARKLGFLPAYSVSTARTCHCDKVFPNWITKNMVSTAIQMLDTFERMLGKGTVTDEVRLRNKGIIIEWLDKDIIGAAEAEVLVMEKMVYDMLFDFDQVDG